MIMVYLLSKQSRAEHREYKADIAPLLLAFKKVLRKCPSAVLVIAGSTIHQGQNRYERGCIDEYDLGEHVNLHTNTSPMIKKCLFAAADVFVAPSDNIVESFGLSILEAMGAKLPVVASDWSGYRELVRDGESGFLIETTVAVDGWRNASVLAECATTPHPEYYLAQRTIVNVGQLADRLCLLGEDRELRQKLGRKGYATVRESYVWSVAIRRFAEVWLQSLATRRSSGTPTMSASAPDLRRVFNSFASGEWTWDGERRVVTSHLCDDICLSHVVMDETTRSILVSCRDQPRTISEVAAGGDYSRRRVLWLMKRGLLEVEQD